jgi:hypothetical protein
MRWLNFSGATPTGVKPGSENRTAGVLSVLLEYPFRMLTESAALQSPRANSFFALVL